MSRANRRGHPEPGPSRCKAQPQPDHDRLLIDVGESLVRFA